MLILFPVILAAASVAVMPCATGTWALKASDQTIFRFVISTTPLSTTAMWERPEHLETDGESFSRVKGPMVRRSSRSVKLVNGDIELTFDDPAPGASPDVFQLHCVDNGRLDATFQGTGFEPFNLVKVSANGPLLGPWEAGRSYVRVVTRPTNSEMTAIFDADQADRQAEEIDWSVVGPADKKRQLRTQDLLNSGALRSGDDFYHAAFVFQHGDVPGDYLKAHLLAMVAAVRGKPEAVWIASATLDRYLQATGQPQVLGTQYKVSKGGAATQEPYDRALVSDAVRRAFHVPTMAEQEQQRQELTAKSLGSKKP
jgi:hypothetical protein